MANAELSLDKAVEDATKANSGYRPDFRENHKEKKPLTLHEGAPSYGRNNELYILHGLSGSRKGLPLLCVSRRHSSALTPRTQNSKGHEKFLDKRNNSPHASKSDTPKQQPGQ